MCHAFPPRGARPGVTIASFLRHGCPRETRIPQSTAPQTGAAAPRRPEGAIEAEAWAGSVLA